MPRFKQSVALVCAAGVAWLSQATMALTDAGLHLDRLALLPLSPTALALCLCAGLAAAAAMRAGVPFTALAPLGLCALPWIPATVPPALLMWSGPLLLLPWTAAILAAATTWRVRRPRVQRPAWAAAGAAALIFSIAAWNVSPNRPGGDEPHYLVITQSLIKDRDLRIENNHANGDYRAFFQGELRPDFRKRGINGEIYSIHAPGLPALIAPVFLLAGYRGVVVFLVLASAAASALAWHLAWLRTRRRDAAWFAWAAVTFGATSVFQAFSIYPDGVGGMLVLTGVWALLRLDTPAVRGVQDRRAWPWLVHGAALACLPWLHTRFAVLAATLELAIVIRLWSTPGRIRKAIAFLGVPVASGAAWIAYFAVLYGVADPSAPYAGESASAAYVVDGLVGLFFDQRFGLITYAPVLVFAVAGFAVMRNRLAIELLAVIVPYLVVATSFRMWWAGWSAPARFMVPVLPLLAVPAAEAWTAIRRRGTRVVAIGALVLTALITVFVVCVDHGRLAYNTRTELSLLLLWFSRNADLASAMPAWSLRELAFFGDVAIWCGAMFAAWAAVRSLGDVPALKSRPALAGATACIFAAAGMAAAAVVWRVNGVDGTAPVSGQMTLLHRASIERRALVVGLQPPRIVAPDAMAQALRIRPGLLAVPQPPSEHAPLFRLPPLPAGEYRLRPGVRGAGGTLTIAVGRDAVPFQTAAIGSTDAIVLSLSVDVSGLTIGGDEQARRNVRTLVVEPLRVLPAGERLTAEPARRAYTYAAATVFFLDDRSFPEPEAFWVGGARDSSVVIRAATPRASIPLSVRNAPVDNDVVLESGVWRVELRLAPGDERIVAVPLDARRGVAPLRFVVSSGFRPSVSDPASHDDRFLGVRVTVQ